MMQPEQARPEVDRSAIGLTFARSPVDKLTMLSLLARLSLKLEAGNPRVEVGGAYVEFHEGDPGEPEKPLLNHLAVLVDSADEHTAEAEDMGIVESVVDAANTRAVFVWGPDRVRIEYVEHKPTFSLQ